MKLSQRSLAQQISVHASEGHRTAKKQSLHCLRESQINEPAPLGMCKMVVAAWQELVSAVSFMSLAQSKPHTMCKDYGHKFYHKDWTGEFPTCADCGVKIENFRELRGAGLRTPAQVDNSQGKWTSRITGSIYRPA